MQLGCVGVDEPIITCWWLEMEKKLDLNGGKRNGLSPTAGCE
jgi:hypothetical protein